MSQVKNNPVSIEEVPFQADSAQVPGSDSSTSTDISTSTALTVAQPAALAAPIDFEDALARLQMWTSYTGPVPKQLEEYYNLPIVVKGMIRQHLAHTNEETGEHKEWDEIRLKLDDDSVIAAAGIGANQFADIALTSLGEGDWPVAMKILVKARTLKSGNKMPSFQVLGRAE